MNELIELLGIVRHLAWLYLWGVFIAATALLLLDTGRRADRRIVEPHRRWTSLEREAAE